MYIYKYRGVHDCLSCAMNRCALQHAGKESPRVRAERMLSQQTWERSLGEGLFNGFLRF